MFVQGIALPADGRGAYQKSGSTRPCAIDAAEMGHHNAPISELYGAA